MWRKLRVYFIGVGLGLILTWALFLRNRNSRDLLAWTPNERVMAPLRAEGGFEKPVQYACWLSCASLTSLNMNQLLEQGKVDFSESQPRQEPKIYHVEVMLEDDREMWARFAIASDSSTVLQGIGITNETLNCDCP